ncbi:DUF5691 domain-containing protein [Nocardiopsis sediminis]|uniref:DUF5691 domain-containing protein n=1 Tax=Nocardiopsis sediminis TaxID=1778267 RepID=A0ABV8FPU1_9ACTN
MPTSDVWADLVSAALVGTGRRAVPDPAGLPAVSEEDPALTLLARAALVAVRDRAGRVAGRADPLPAAPAETAPVVGDAAALRLRGLLDDAAGTGVHLGEWLDLAAERGRRVPPHLLPRLLDAGARDRGLGRRVARVCGERGFWLAGVAPQWSYLLRLAPVGAFTVEQWRAGDADRRHRLLESLEDGLSPGDEPLLAEALADASPRVRGLAMALTARLGDTERGRRLAGHARRHIAPAPAGLRVTLPDLTDSALARDLNVTAPKGGDPRGEIRREWLWSLVSHTPLGTWTGHFGGDRAHVAGLAADSGDGDLLDALANAAVVQRDAAWARALLPACLDRLTRGHDLRGSRGRALLALLPVAERCAWAAERGTGASAGALLTAVEQLSCPWTEELGALVARAILREPATDLASAPLAGLCREAETWLPPRMHPLFDAFADDDHHVTDEADEDAHDAGGDRRDPRARLARTLRFRSDLHEELR